MSSPAPQFDPPAPGTEAALPPPTEPSSDARTVWATFTTPNPKAHTASGEPFQPWAMLGAHPSLPFGSRVRVTSKASGKSVVVRIVDRCGCRGGIGLTVGAARAIGMERAGVVPVEIAVVN
ncbi:MAG: hypothetical protein JO366_11610 [Methylobacteriaceae bacterium]|nr:hypothetical protein [Methylobacteriaceae bacterium]MBV9245447.1 hypothetical protein [Methylobacteriaceae bacterium]MBV9637462.1 hypothetical protein [Methylobacteriaceae bacterium]